METTSVERVCAPTDEVRGLIDELDRTLSMEYLPEQRHGIALDALFQPSVRFFIARLAGVAVGCGGVAFGENYGEVKRMYVRDVARGRGLARALLARIEIETVNCGRRLLRLETGSRQLDALRLYYRAGFSRCEPFGNYIALAPLAIATSVFLEKRLNR
jgi:putative acetyltransferase